MDYTASPLNFYTVDSDYVDYLQSAEMAERGFSRVPNMRYSPEQKKKFVCGIVLQIGENLYCVPVSSYKKKQDDNFLILDQKGNTIASLRFNYMFPVRDSQLRVRSIADEPDEKYKRLLQAELRFCIANEEAIRAQAAKTYRNVIKGYNEGLVQNSCAFLLLEQACNSYQSRLDEEKKKENIQSRQEMQASDGVRDASEATNHGDGFTSLPMPHETEQNESDASTALTQQDEEIAQGDSAQREVPPSAQSEPTQTSGSASLWQMVANMPPQPAAPTSGPQSSNSNNGPVSE